MRGWRLGSRTATSHPPGSGRGGSTPRGRGRARLVAKGGEVGGFGHCSLGSLRRLSSPSDPKGSPKQAYRVRRRHSRQCVGWNGADAPRKSLQRGRLSGCGSSRRVETAPTCSIRLYLHVRTCACTRTRTCTCRCTCCAVCSAVQAVAVRCACGAHTHSTSPHLRRHRKEKWRRRPRHAPPSRSSGCSGMPSPPPPPPPPPPPLPSVAGPWSPPELTGSMGGGRCSGAAPSMKSVARWSGGWLRLSAETGEVGDLGWAAGSVIYAATGGLGGEPLLPRACSRSARGTAHSRSLTKPGVPGRQGVKPRRR